MKRKPTPREERRRPLAEINLVGDGSRRIPVSRKGCFGLFGSLLAVMAGAVPLGVAVVTAIR